MSIYSARESPVRRGGNDPNAHTDIFIRACKAQCCIATLLEGVGQQQRVERLRAHIKVLEAAVLVPKGNTVWKARIASKVNALRESTPFTGKGNALLKTLLDLEYEHFVVFVCCSFCGPFVRV